MAPPSQVLEPPAIPGRFSRQPASAEGAPPLPKPSAGLTQITQGWADWKRLDMASSQLVRQWFSKIAPLVDDSNKAEDDRLDKLSSTLATVVKRDELLKRLNTRLPAFVLFNNYFRVNR